MKAAANRVCGGDHAGDAAFWRVKYRFWKPGRSRTRL